HVFLRAFARVPKDHNAGTGLAGSLQNRVKFSMKSTGYDQHGSAELFQRHEHLLRGLRLGNNAHFVLNCEHLCDPCTKDCLVISQNQFEHCLSTSRLANEVISIDHTSYALRFTTPCFL